MREPTIEELRGENAVLAGSEVGELSLFRDDPERKDAGREFHAPDDAGGLHVLLVLLHQRRAAHGTRVLHPARDADREDEHRDGDAVVLLLENEYVPWLDISAAGNSFRGAATGTDFGADTARNLLCGRQAALMAEASNPEALVVEQFDYKNKDGVAVSFIGGVQKAMFNSLEFGVIALDAAAAV